MKSTKWVCDLCNQEQETCARITAFGPSAENQEASASGPLKRRSTDRPLKLLLELDVCHTCLPGALKDALNRIRWKEKPWIKIEVLERAP